MNREQILRAKDQLDKLNGVGKHNTPGNFCRGDTYFAISIEREFGMTTTALTKVVKEFMKEERAKKPFSPAKLQKIADAKFLCELADSLQSKQTTSEDIARLLDIAKRLNPPKPTKQETAKEKALAKLTEADKRILGLKG